MKQNKLYEEIARRCIEKYSELKDLRNHPCNIAILESDEEKKSKGRRICAECMKIPKKFKWMREVDFQIVVYEPNCAHMTDEQLEILLWHELMHIGVTVNEDGSVDYGIKDHDVQDFRVILELYGVDWDKPDDGQITFDGLQSAAKTS